MVLTPPCSFYRFVVAVLNDSIFNLGLATTEAFHYHSYFCTIVNINGCENLIVIVITFLFSDYYK